ncbi:hypothetical protein H2204_009608 [Knufia peltigerae]|uniref:Aldehyde dehydrogenase domain-containing protein n=1 Tax=Knufia peltigerae TaxID=1002370 RepID=A0AA39CUZ3_9EURO|nr:hypothetical protein H2204_009608 [Knufia peltigerae]
MEQIWKLDTLSSAEAFISNQDGQSLLTLENYIGGQFSENTSENIFISSFNPKTGREYAKVPVSDETAVQSAVDAAKAAFPSWAKLSRRERSHHLRRIASLLQENRELLAVWESIDQGKTLERARVEIDRAVSNFQYFSSYILHDDNRARMVDGVALTYEHRSAIGPFALISPWNMPLYLLTWKIAPCIAFGCTAVAKPSEVTSMTAYLLAEVLRRAELPPGVVNIIFGDGRTTGTAVVTNPDIHGVSFTGGTATGVQIRKLTAEYIYKHVSLELGGKNPTLVFEDVELDEAVRVASQAAFENQGEICLCGSRIYVHSSIYDDFIAKFKSHAAQAYRSQVTMGAIVSLPHYQKIRSYLELAKDEGAKFELGDIPPREPQNGYWMDPVVLTGVSQSSRVVQEEIFGPVVTIAQFDTEETAVQLANDNANGLASVVLTRDGKRMRRVGEQIQAGLVWVNCWLVRELGTPFGGMKNSGVGREGGDYSRDVFTNVRTIHLAQ